MHLRREELQRRYELYKKLGSYRATAKTLGLNKESLRTSLIRAANRGDLGTNPVLPGFAISKTTAVKDESGAIVREFIQQKPEHGGAFEIPDGHKIKGVSALVDANGQIIQQWQKTSEDDDAKRAIFEAEIAALREELPRILPTQPPENCQAELLNQFTITDSHFGMLAWGEETGGSDYDLDIAEKLLLDWFSAAIQGSPRADTAVLAQLGDLMHHDALEAVTPAHGHILDADSRLQKVIRVVIHTVRRIIGMLLETHKHVHIVMASGNHDPASSAWLREMLAAMYELEPRVSVDNSPMLYYSYEWGNVALFYSHGHKGGLKTLDVRFASLFRELYGRTRYAYAHTGHRHTDETVKTDLMLIEQHETLAAHDAFAATVAGAESRSAKRITYHREFGEVARARISPEMILEK